MDYAAREKGQADGHVTRLGSIDSEGCDRMHLTGWTLPAIRHAKSCKVTVVD